MPHFSLQHRFFETIILITNVIKNPYTIEAQILCKYFAEVAQLEYIYC